MIETAKMSTRGQIIIPKTIREHMQAEEGTIFTMCLVDKKTLMIRIMDQDDIIKKFNEIRNRIKGNLTDEEINEEIQACRREKRKS